MSDIRFNRWLHQSGTGGVSQDSSGNIGIGTTVPTMALDVRGDINVGDTININNASGIISATTITATTGTFSGSMSVTGNVSIAGTLTYEDVTNIDAVGVVTAKAGIDVTGGHIDLVDDSKIRVGTGDDLQIYHDASHSYIEESGTGALKLKGNDIRIENTSSRNVFKAVGTACELFFDNGSASSKKLETTNTGAVVTGILTATTFSGDLTGNLTGNVTGDLTGKLAGISSIAAISSTISGTAYDTFVYDTRKDSDGGAWRKRTQHTSWYNITNYEDAWIERGSRKEFPAIAVIVADSSGVAIRDGDDPDLSLWMKFKTSGTGPIYVSPTPGALAALNGIIFVGANNGGSGSYVSEFGFIHDKMRLHQGASLNQARETWITGMVQKSGGSSWTSQRSPISISNDYGLIDRKTNDIAMTVLPNAPIDEVSGLPRLTIAVATDGGVSVIRDDGRVADWTETSGPNSTHKLSFRKDGKLGVFSSGTAGPTGYPQLYYIDIPNSDISVGYYYDYPSNNFERYGGTAWESNSSANLLLNNGSTSAGSASLTDMVDTHNLTYAATGDGLNAIIRPEAFISGEADMKSAAVAYIQKDYNTGYMHGDIKGAFLSDTDTTNLVATDLDIVTNGNFAADSDWTKGTGWSISGGTATHTGSGGDIKQQIAVVSGKRYLMTVTVDLTGDTSIANTTLGFRTLANDGYYVSKSSWTANAVNSIGLYWTSTVTGNILARCYSSDDVSLDNWVVQDVTDGNSDRSVNNTGLQVVGTVTKSAVATGADLVAYSGYSASNYLVQPSITAPGTGDFSVTSWIKPGTLNSGSGNYVHLFSLGTNTTGGQGSSTGFVLKLTTHTGGNANGYSPYFYNGDGGTNHGTYNVSNFIPLGKWSQLVAMRRGGVPYIYLNGNLIKTGNSWTTNLTDTYLTVFRGIGYSEHGGDAEFALLRYSHSAPSAEQIKKIYEDEKHLFQENAKATLYGSSDAVTALGYDDDTDLLHVGTSAGRSDFQGLRRINNTTTAVTTAISASDDLIAEQ